jgi:hypothetical protein
MPISLPAQNLRTRDLLLTTGCGFSRPAESGQNLLFAEDQVLLVVDRDVILRMKRLAADLSSHFKVLGFLFLAIDLLLRTLFLVELRRFDDRSLGFCVRAL